MGSAAGRILYEERFLGEGDGVGILDGSGFSTVRSLSLTLPSPRPSASLPKPRIPILEMSVRGGDRAWSRFYGVLRTGVLW